MKKRTICIAIMSMCALPFISRAQMTAKALKNGDKVPDVAIRSILNYNNIQANISDFRGKLLILDFWGRYCASCISGFPKMEALQNKFPGRVQVLLVTKDKKKDLKSLFERSANLKSTKLPIVVGDSILSELFPYTGVPHQVWIDEDGIARAAGNSFTNEENVRNFLEGKIISLPYRLPYQDFDGKRSLLMEGGGRQLKNLRYYSFFMGRLDGTERGFGLNRLSDTINGQPIYGIQRINQSILQLVENAFKFYVSSSPSNHLILQAIDPQAYQWPKANSVDVDVWKSKNLYSYGLFLPNANDEELNAIMQEDLQRYFKIKVNIERRKMKSRVLIRTTDDDRIQAKDTERFEEFTKDSFVLKSQQFGTFFWYLKDANTNFSDAKSLPFVDGTGFRPVKLIDLEIKSKINDLPTLKKELSRYGLDIIEEEREVNVMFITEKDYHG